MRRSARRLWTLTACGLCILGAVAAIAAASPAHAVSRHTRVAAKRCKRSRAHRSRARRTACPSRHSTRKAGPAPAAAAPKASAPAGTPAGTPTTSTAPAAVTPAAPAEEPGTKTPPSVPHVQVTSVEYHYTLSRTSVPAGKVVLQFVNDGEDEHNLNVLPAEGGPAGTFGNLASKAMSSQEIELRPGSYTLFCSLPEHEKKGMKATLTVE